MANRLYTKIKDAILNGGIDFDTDTLKLIGCSAAYSADTATDEFLDDITAGRVTSGVTLTGVTVSGGVFDANSPTFTAVTGAAITQWVLYKDTGVEGTSRLVAIWDTGTNIPATPNGGDLTFNFHASGALALT